MAKRVADTQLTKDGALSDGEGFSDGSQMGGPRRATAAQMAARRLAKPRGGRRPGTPGQTRPAPAASQPQQSPFQFSNSTTVNGTQQQQNPFSSLNGNTTNPPNNTSQSFPPFGSNSNSSLNTQFTAPSSSEFNFSAGSSESITNPFAKHIPIERLAGFQGDIFSMPAPPIKHDSWVRDREGIEEPKFAAHSPFHNGNQDSTLNQKEQSENSPTMGANQHQPSQTGSGLFSQSTSQEPQSNQVGNNVFSQLAPPQQQTTNNIFGNVQPQPQSQPASQAQATPSSNILGSVFQQSKSTPSTHNFFAHLGSPQPSASLGQPSSSPAQEDQSMMSTSPDTSPSSRPFGFLNGVNNQTQSSPTKDSPALTAGTSLFDRVSKPTTEANTSAFQDSTKETTTPGAGGSLFDRVSKPTSEASVAASVGATGKSSSQEGSGNLFGHITKHPGDPSAQSQVTPENGSPSKIQQKSNTNPFPPVTSDNSQPQKKKLFGHSLNPQAAQPASATPNPTDSLVNGPGASNFGSKAANDPSEAATQTAQAPRSNKRKLDTPPQAPSDFTADQKKQLTTGYRLRHFDECMRKRLRTKPPEKEIRMLKEFYAARVKSIRRADGGELETIEEMVSGTKRKASGELSKGKAKKPRKSQKGSWLHSLEKNDGSPSNSQTSNLFKNIVDTKDGQGIANGAADGKSPLFAPSRLQVKQSTMPPPPKPTTNSSSNLFAQHKHADPPIRDTVPPASSTTQVFGTYKASSSESPAPFITNQATSASASSDTSKTSAFQFPKVGTNAFSNTETTNPATTAAASSDTPKSTAFQFPKVGINTSPSSGSSSPFSIKPTTSSDPSSSVTQNASGFKAPTAPMFASGTPSTSAPPNPFSYKSTANENASADIPKVPAFKVPTFGAGTTTNFMAQFGKEADKVAEDEKRKRKAEDYDSDEEDEATWERRYEEELRAKKQKLEEASRAGTPRFVNGKLEWTGATSGDSASATASESKPASPAPSIFDQPMKPMSNHQNIFGHLSGSESGAEGSKTGDADDEDDGAEHEEENEKLDDFEKYEDDDEDDNGGFRPPSEGSSQSSDDDEERATNNKIDGKSAGTQLPNYEDFLKLNAPSPSLFDRISKDGNGNPIREVPKPDEKSSSKASGIFGQGASFKSTSSGFATSNSFGSPEAETSNAAVDKAPSTAKKHVFGQVSSSPPSSNASSKLAPSNSASDSVKASDSLAENRTWKTDSPIKFGTQSNTPAVNITAPSPSKSYSGLFGAPKTNAPAESPAAPLFSFATPSAKPTNTSLGFNFTPAKPAANALAAPSNTASGVTSRATSPGVTTGESANESNPEHNESDAPPEAQLDLVSEGPGEENEDTIFKVRAKALTWDETKKDWVTRGLGPLRVLKHRETDVTRILLRQYPSGRIVINTNLLKGVNYENPQDKILFVPVVEENGNVVRYMVKVGKEEDGEELTEILMDNRPS